MRVHVHLTLKDEDEQTPNRTRASSWKDWSTKFKKGAKHSAPSIMLPEMLGTLWRRARSQPAGLHPAPHGRLSEEHGGWEGSEADHWQGAYNMYMNCHDGLTPTCATYSVNQPYPTPPSMLNVSMTSQQTTAAFNMQPHQQPFLATSSAFSLCLLLQNNSCKQRYKAWYHGFIRGSNSLEQQEPLKNLMHHQCMMV
jgi:hypothetical protein